jgi:hypothetical protein
MIVAFIKRMKVFENRDRRGIAFFVAVFLLGLGHIGNYVQTVDQFIWDPFFRWLLLNFWLWLITAVMIAMNSNGVSDANKKQRPREPEIKSDNTPIE